MHAVYKLLSMELPAQEMEVPKPNFAKMSSLIKKWSANVKIELPTQKMEVPGGSDNDKK